MGARQIGKSTVVKQVLKDISIPYQLFSPRAAGVCSNKANVPADLQSAGTEYKDFSIRLLPIFLINKYESRITN